MCQILAGAGLCRDHACVTSRVRELQKCCCLIHFSCTEPDEGLERHGALTASFSCVRWMWKPVAFFYKQISRQKKEIALAVCEGGEAAAPLFLLPGLSHLVNPHVPCVWFCCCLAALPSHLGRVEPLSRQLWSTSKLPH